MFSILLLFILGIVVGSFLGVIVDRIPRGEQILVGHSHCDYCHHTLGILDLIPVVSYLCLRGRCRYCHKKLSFFYPFIELSTAFAFALLAWNIYWLILSSIFIVIFFADLRFGIIPDVAVFTGILLVLLRLMIDYLKVGTDLSNYLIAGFVTFGIFLAIVVVTRGHGMGLGDVKYAFFMGLLLGFPRIIFAFYMSFLTGALMAVILLVGGKKHLGQTMYFGPYLVFGTIFGLVINQSFILYWQKLLY